MRGAVEAMCSAYGRVAALGQQSTRVDTSAANWFRADGPIGPRGVSAIGADLLDIAGVVYRSERQLPRRAASNPNVKFELTMPVRDPAAWNGSAGRLLEELLGFLGSADWKISFVQRRRRSVLSIGAISRERSIARVALLSGGLDSTCGAGSGLISPHDAQLCSFYTRQRALQRDIADELGFTVPTQWWHHAAAGPGRSFYYRSFLFLSLAAITADTWGAREIVQFENGILASGVPPVPSLAMTKHAHPRLQQLFASLLASTLGGEWRISNPFWQMTKREGLHALERGVGIERAASLAAATETCWNLSAPHAYGVRECGRQIKHANEQCGVCMPCIVRRTALPRERFAFDLRRPIVRDNPKLAAHFFEYFEFLSVIRDADTLGKFRMALPAEALELIDHGWTDLASIERLFRLFASEFFETFF